MAEHRYVPGKVDYYGTGRANCEAELTWALQDGRFSMCAGIWRPNKSDLETCGQCIDTVADYFPDDPKVQRMRSIWQRWHLNDMRAGSPAQEAWLRDNPIPEAEYQYPKSYYVVACEKLAAAGLNPDNGYSYGHAWNTEVLPEHVRAEIESWG